MSSGRINLLKYNIVGISGPIGSGKDTVANWIARNSHQQYNIVSFATPLRDAAKAMFGWSDFQLQDRVAKEQVDPFWGFSPRTALQLLGTEYGRQKLRDDVWILAAKRKVDQNHSVGIHTVIQDVRFQNEDEFVRSYPNHLRIYMDSNESHPTSTHVSEAGVPFQSGDIVIYNDKSKGLVALENVLNTLFSFGD